MGCIIPNSEPWIRFWYIASSNRLMWMPYSVTLPMLVSTTVPALRIEAKASATWSPLTTPTVTMAEAAP